MKPNILPQHCLYHFPWARFPENVRATAVLLRNSLVKGHQIPLLSKKNTDLDQSNAYEISAASCALAMFNRVRPVGRKIGFTNTKIWSEYNVSEPNWGYIWEDRARTAKESQRAIWLSPTAMALQPRIEPEIVFRLKKKPHSQMTEREVLSCIEWIAHGYEIVNSLFKDWKFTAADTTATNALHDRLIIGPKRVLGEKDLDTLPAELENFEIKLYRNKELVDTGHGSNVLGSPIQALLYLCRMLESQVLHPGLLVGEIITTGTLTKAMPIDLRQTWSTTIKGIDLPGLELKTVRAPPRTTDFKVRYHTAWSKSTSREHEND